MFCNLCGNPMADTETFCPRCGNNILNQQQGNTEGNQNYSQNFNQNFNPNMNSNWNQAGAQFTMNGAPQKKKFNYKILIIVGIAVAALLFLICFIFGIYSLTSRSQDELIEKYVEATYNGKAQDIVDLLPEEMIEKTIEEESFLNKKELVEELNQNLETYLEEIESLYGRGWKLSYTIKEKNPYETEELRELRKEYKEDYDVRLQIEKASRVKIEITVSSKDKEMLGSSTLYMDIVKIGNSWYILEV